MSPSGFVWKRSPRRTRNKQPRNTYDRNDRQRCADSNAATPPGKGKRVKSWYDILGVSPQAHPDQIKQAYRRLAVQYHPDRNRNNAEAEKRMKEINQAYNMLCRQWREKGHTETETIDFEHDPRYAWVYGVNQYNAVYTDEDDEWIVNRILKRFIYCIMLVYVFWFFGELSASLFYHPDRELSIFLGAGGLSVMLCIIGYRLIRYHRKDDIIITVLYYAGFVIGPAVIIALLVDMKLNQ